MSSNITISHVQTWYNKACIYSQALGLVLAFSGVIVNQSPLLSLIFLLCFVVFSIVYLRSSNRKQTKTFIKDFPAKEKAIMSTALQSFFMFSMTIVFECALIAKEGVKDFAHHPFHLWILIFGIYGFYGQYHINRFLKKITTQPNT